jgi:hypothetical protein
MPMRPEIMIRSGMPIFLRDLTVWALMMNGKPLIHHANYNGYYFENAPVKLQYDKPYEPEAQFDQAIYLKHEKKSKSKN